MVDHPHNIVVYTPDTWAYLQLTLISLMAQLPKDTPLNITCGNSAPKPGVVFYLCIKWRF
jgi:L-fucose/D-arabinose isomerase